MATPCQCPMHRAEREAEARREAEVAALQAERDALQARVRDLEARIARCVEELGSVAAGLSWPSGRDKA